MLRSITTHLPPRLQDAKKTSTFFLLTLFTFSLFSTVLAEEWKSPDPDTSLAHFPTKLVQDIPHLFITDNGIPFVVGGFLTASDWALFDSTHSAADSLRQWNTPGLFDFGNFYGEGWVEGGSALGCWSLGALVNDPKMGEFGRDTSESLLLSTALVSGLKYAVGRERPDQSDNFSFPSGHAITAFCFAPVVQKYWGWEAGIPAYLLATVTGLARVEGYHHYLSDVLAGATLGIVIGNAVVYRPKDVSISVAPGRVKLQLAFN
ncbi:MAG TPA: phosphatase PAP2 family protein [bacterium]|nr:phosphatase PAP2 family protein [bacterium]